MGFKRTSEGRVFFQGADQTANDHVKVSQNTQVQILSLLKALNDKLQTTQAERNKMRKELEDYRDIIEDLEKKVETRDTQAEARVARAEHLARETLKEMEETRKLMLDIEERAEKADKGVVLLTNQIGKVTDLGDAITRKQSLIEKQQKDQSSQITANATSYEELVRRIQDAELNYEKVTRKIDKVIEDRTRFMRKIERIEEAVMQTRDALNAKAMVLLTEQGTPGHTPAAQGGQILASVPHEAVQAGQRSSIYQGNEEKPWWRSWSAAAAVVVLIAASAMTGWMLSGAQMPGIPALQSYETASTDTDITEEAAMPAETTDVVEKPEAPEDWTVSSDTQAFSESASPATNEDTAAADDIGTINLEDEKALAELLEQDPDALATELNKIEPSLSKEGQAILKGEKEGGYAAPASLPKDAAANGRSDPGLPDIVKDIERQAFAGVSAAQHDLAAIYTAGHGGVKQDYAKAAYWFRKAADAGVANAAYNLGVLYHQGLGMKPDIMQAIDWYKKASTLGHPEAQYNLGIAYIEGIGVDYNPAVAAEYFKNASSKGVMEAAYNLGLVYENGLLGKAQPDVALMWYKNAADQGSPEAKAALEQLAKTLGITISDVNRVVDDVKAGKKVDMPTKAAAPPVGKQTEAVQPPASPAPPSLGGEQTLLVQIQKHLMEEGLYPGPADGKNGPLTEDAIRTYQAMNNLDVDGRPTEILLNFMQSDFGN